MNVDELRAALENGREIRYLLFWGHRQKKAGATDASCLSQWFAAEFVVDGEIYPTAEHWLMAGKARLFSDEDILARIFASEEPGKAKSLGYQVRDFDEELWNAHRFQLAVQGNQAKFSQNPNLKDFLLNTGDRVLVEASPRDPIWGIGIGRDDEAATDPFRWRGSNLLGFALMEVRRRLGGHASE